MSNHTTHTNTRKSNKTRKVADLRRALYRAKVEADREHLPTPFGRYQQNVARQVYASMKAEYDRLTGK